MVNLRRLLAMLLIEIALPLSAAQNSGGSIRLERADPQPEEATRAILEAFNTYQVVGLAAAHHLKDLDDFILSLIRRPAFSAAVNDIVVECGNSLYQSTLDRYIAGENVPLVEVRQVWRNTTQTMCNVSTFYEELFPLVRAINQRLAPEKRLRVLAGDPPIDWRKVNSRAEVAYLEQFMRRRDANVASVMEKEVFAKRRKALMLFGSMHLFHGIGENAVGLYEKKHAGVTLVIYTHGSFGCDAPARNENDELEARISSWTAPALSRIKGTWLGDLREPPLPPLAEIADAYLYLGPRELALSEPSPALYFLDKDAMSELDRRTKIGAGLMIADNVDPEQTRKVDANPLRCNADVRFR